MSEPVVTIDLAKNPAVAVSVATRAPHVGVSVPAVHASVTATVQPAADISMPGIPGPVGPQGPAGPPGAPGADYDPAEADLRYVNLTGDTVPGLLVIDRGPGAGVPLMQFRTNAGQNTISSDASSNLTFSNAVVVPQLYTAGLGFSVGGAQVDMNGGSVIQAGKFTVTGSTGHIRNYSDYNASQAVTDQGIIHTYANRQSGAPPQVAFQAHKSGDPTEQPFMISSNGYGWLRNLDPTKATFIVRAAPSQAVESFRIEDHLGAPLLTLGPNGELRLTNGAVYSSIKVDPDGTVNYGNLYPDLPKKHRFLIGRPGSTYGDALVVSNGATGASMALQPIAAGNMYITTEAGQPGSLTIGKISNPYDGTELVMSSGAFYITAAKFGVGKVPTANLDVAGDAAISGNLTVAGSPVWKAWSGTQAQYDAIVTKDPGTLYAVTG